MREQLPSHSTSESEAPIGGAYYRHPARRGRWRIETVGPKWIKFRSTEMVVRGGAFWAFKERREDWPNGWTRV